MDLSVLWHMALTVLCMALTVSVFQHMALTALFVMENSNGRFARRDLVKTHSGLRGLRSPQILGGLRDQIWRAPAQIQVLKEAI